MGRYSTNVRGPEDATYFVYALIDPRDGEIRYIGCSVHPDVRVKQHTQDVAHYASNFPKHPATRRPKFLWLNSLRRARLTPRVRVLEVVPSETAAQRERRWIILLRKRGVRLVNGHYFAPRPEPTVCRVRHCRFCRSTSHMGNKCHLRPERWAA